MKTPKYNRFKHPGSSDGNQNPFRLLQILLLIFASIWLLAVVKVFLLEKSRVYAGEAGRGSIQQDDTIEIPVQNNGKDMGTVEYRSIWDKKKDFDGQPISTDSLPRIGDWSIIRAPISETVTGERKSRPLFQQRKAPLVPSPPKSTEVLPEVKLAEPPKREKSVVRDTKEQKAASVEETSSKAVISGKTWPVPASDLAWPPVLPGGALKEGEGFEVMAMTGLKVPRFWEPPKGVDPNDLMSEVNGHETIFLMIASYRDFQCRETIASAFERADYPERLFVGAVDQVVPGDTGCLDLAVPCSQNPQQKICIYMNQISVFTMDATLATGPVTARHIGDRMYRGQQFFMQMDAHCQFVNHWDTGITNQWKSTNNEMAVLSSYLTDVQGSINKDGNSNRNTRPIMCNSDFEGAMPARYIRHNSQPEEEPAIKDMPQMQPYWAAGFSFSRGHFIVRVPYDAYQSMVFQGEEISIGVRGFTFGYDFYAPRDSVVFHEYAERSTRRKKIPMFWENQASHRGAGIKALKRSMSLIGMAPDIDPSEWDHSEEQKYGIGDVRSVDLFYKLFLIDTKERKAEQLCPFVKSGKMHRNFQPYLRPDKRGIDYSKLESFDTKAVIENHYAQQRPFGEDMIRNAIKKRSRPDLDAAISNAQRIGLDRSNPALFQQAKDEMKGL